MIKYPLKVVPVEGEDLFSDIADANDSTLALNFFNEVADSLVLRLNWLSSYNDLFLKEMGSLEHLITFMQRQINTARKERDEAIERYEKLIDWEY